MLGLLEELGWVGRVVVSPRWTGHLRDGSRHLWFLTFLQDNPSSFEETTPISLCEAPPISSSSPGCFDDLNPAA